MSSLMPTNTRRKPSCVETLAKSVIREAEAAQSEVTAIPAGGHAILDQARATASSLSNSSGMLRAGRRVRWG